MTMKRNCISVPIEVFAGHIREAVSRGIELSRKIDCPVHMEFNKTDVFMQQDSDVEGVVADYDRRFGHKQEEEAPDLRGQRDRLRQAMEAILRVYEKEDADDDEIEQAMDLGRRALVKCVLADMKD